MKKGSGQLYKVILIGLFTLAFFGTRIPKLAKDAINPDGVNWHYRSQQFIVGLKFFELEKTYQHYHPGVTLMWVTGIPIEIFKQITNTPHYDINNFLSFHLVAKVSVILAQFVLSLLVLYLLEKIIGLEKAFFTTVLFTFEPFFVGNSRLYHMDVLVTLLLFAGLLYSFINLKKTTFVTSVLSGLFLSLAFLTKSVALGGLVFVLFYSALYFLVNKSKKDVWKCLGATTLSFVVFTFLLFPALWKNPVYFLGEIFSEGARVGIRKGHGQILLGEYTQNAGAWFYPLVLLLKMSPLVLVGLLFFQIFSFRKAKDLFKQAKEKLCNLTVFLGIFYLGYIVIMTFPSKKIDRYMLVAYPFLAYLAVLGFSKLLKRFRIKFGMTGSVVFWVLVVSLVGAFWVKPLISLYPYYFTYTSPIFGSAQRANEIIAQKPFGVGVPELKQFILESYEGQPKLGFIDTKPIRSIYPNSKVFDIRVSGTSDYDLLVLAINEEIPEKVLNSSYIFEKDSSLWINGLEYWRIYVKKER